MPETDEITIQDESTGKISDYKKKKIWHRQHDIILKEWAEICSSYRWLHYNSYRYYRRNNTLLTIPVIMISTIAGSLSFAQSGITEQYKEYISTAIGCVNMIATVISSVAQYLRSSELAENHRLSSLSFGKLARTIKAELALPIQGRTFDGKTFVKVCKIEIDRLLEQSNVISKSILENFETKFSNINITKPEILQIKEVKIFIDEDSQYLPYIHEEKSEKSKKSKKYKKSEKSKNTYEKYGKMSTKHIRIQNAKNSSKTKELK